MREPGVQELPDPKDFRPRRRDPRSPWEDPSKVRTPQSTVQRYDGETGYVERSPASAGFTAAPREGVAPPPSPTVPPVPRTRRKK